MIFGMMFFQQKSVVRKMRRLELKETWIYQKMEHGENGKQEELCKQGRLIYGILL